MPPGVNRVEIPFEEINNLIVIPVAVNQILKLKFVVDTGVETTILTEPGFAPLLNIELYRKLIISGAGINDSIGAYVGNAVNFSLPGGINGTNMSILVLEEDFLDLSEKMGTDIHGIIGYDLFRHFTVEFLHELKVMRLHGVNKFKPRKRHKELDLDIRNTKPYVEARITNNDRSDTVQLMIDSGASHAILLDPNQSKIKTPRKTIETRLGTGLGGEINGKLGRLNSISIGEFTFNEVLASIPKADSYSRLIKRGARQGTIGGEILSRLNQVFDYTNKKLYISKSKYFSKPFEADMSGLSLVAKGAFLDTLMVDFVQKKSPAFRAGILPGDILQSVDSQNLQIANFGEIQGILRGRPKRKVRFRIIRNGEKLKRVIRLRRQI